MEKQVWFNCLHIYNNTNTRQIYNYYDDTFNKKDQYYKYRRIDDKSNPNYISFTYLKEIKGDREDKKILKQIIKCILLHY